MVKPTMINNKIIKAIENVVNDDINSIILTDEELVIEANEKLSEINKFSYSAFKDWKAFAVGAKKESETNEENYKIYMRLGSIIKKALTKQKQNLFEMLRKDKRSWQKWAWIIERKFDDWNIRYKVEQKVDTTVTEKPDEETKKLLDKINKLIKKEATK